MKSTRTILLLEDDANLAFILSEHLEMNGFRVRHSTNGVDGLSVVRKERFALCLVDVMMPRKDGFTFVKELRQRDKDIPVIFLTAKSLKEDRIEGLRIGADDYITKPFSMEELLLRITAVLKRSTPAPAPVRTAERYAIGPLSFDVKHSTISGPKVRERKLTTKESELLAILCEHCNTVVDREVILSAVWNTDTPYAARSMDVYISKLRKYFKAAPSVSIVNVHGKGYKLLTDD